MMCLITLFFPFLETDSEFALHVEQIGGEVKAECVMVLQGQTGA